MEGSEILYCLKKGDFDYTVFDVQEYLLVPLESRDSLTESQLKRYSDLACRFFHQFVYKLNDIPNLETSLSVIQDCYVVAKICPVIKTGVDPLHVENLLYHLCCKLIKKQLLSWAHIFCTVVVKEWTVLTSGGDHKEALANLSYSLYVSLWNATILANTQAGNKGPAVDVLVCLECRLTALRLLALAGKEVGLLVKKTLSAVTKVSSVVTSKPATRQKTFDIVDQMVRNALREICKNPDEIGKHINEVLISQLQLLLLCEAYPEALLVSRGVCWMLDYIGTKNGLTQVVRAIGELLGLAVQAYQLKVQLAQSKTLGDVTELTGSLMRCGKLLKQLSKTPCKLHHIILHSASYTLEALQYQLMQRLSHLKITTSAARDVNRVMAAVVDVNGAMATLCDGIMTQLTTADDSQAKLWQHLIDCQIAHLNAVYYFLTLFIEDASVSEIHKSTAQCIRGVKKALVALDTATSFNADSHAYFVEAVFKIGRQCYLSRQFVDAKLYLVMICTHIRDLKLQNRNLPKNILNGSYHAFLADTYRHNNDHQTALECIVHGIRMDANELNDLVRCWVKVKVELQEMKHGESQPTRTLRNCYKDPTFVKFLPQSPDGRNYFPDDAKQLSPKILLEAERKALKEHWCPGCPVLLTVNQELLELELVTDPLERSLLLAEQVPFLWVSHRKDRLRKRCDESISEMEKALARRKSITDHPYLENQLATANLWAYVVHDVDPVQMMKTLQEKKEKDGAPGGDTASNSRPGSPTGEHFTDAENFEDCVTVAMETKLLLPVDRALDLWEKLVSSGQMENCIQSVKETTEHLLIVVAIYKLAKKHTQHWRALVVCLKLANATRCWQLCLKVRVQLLQLLNDLRQPQLSEEVMLETEVWIDSVKTDKLLHGIHYAEYLMAKAHTLLLLGKGEAVLAQSLHLKSKHIKSRTRDGMLVEAAMNSINSQLMDVHAHRDATVLPSADTKIELLNRATRLVSNVVCTLLGSWVVNQSSVAGIELDQAPDNTLDKWLLLDRLLMTLYNAGLHAIELGKARNAFCLLTVGVRLSKAFLLPRRLAEFHVALASLDTLRGRHTDCQGHLRVVAYILHSNANTTGHPKPTKLPDEDDTMDFQIKSQPMGLDDDDPDRVISDSGNFDRSGCASPSTRRTKVKVPESWSHKVTCPCVECSDLVQVRLGICRLSVEAQMNIYLEDFAEAQASLQVIVKNLSHLIAKSQYVLRNIGQDIKVMSGKDGCVKLVDENGASVRIEPVYQELMVDVCLQMCTVAVEVNNSTTFDKWSKKCLELCDTERYPWMYSKQIAHAELLYLSAARYLAIEESPSKAYDIDKLCVLIGGAKIADGTVKECHTPKTSKITTHFRNPGNKDIPKKSVSVTDLTVTKPPAGNLLRPSRSERKLSSKEESFDLTTEMPKKTEKGVRFSHTPQDPPAESPAHSTGLGISNVTMAPVKAKRSRGSRIASRNVERTAKVIASDITVSSPSILKAKTPMTKQETNIRPRVGVPLRVYQEPDKEIFGRTPVKMLGVNIGNMMKTPVSVCSSRRAVLDLLIDSDDDDLLVVAQKSTKNSKARAHLKVPATEKSNRQSKASKVDNNLSEISGKHDSVKKTSTGILSRKSKSAKASLLTEKNVTLAVKSPGPVQALFSRRMKKVTEAIKDHGEANTENIYDFMDHSDDDNKAKVKAKKLAKKKGSRSRSSKDSPFEVEATRSSNESGVFTDPLNQVELINRNSVVEPIRTTSNKRKSSTPRAKETTAKPKGNPRLTRAKTKVTESNRNESGDDNREMEPLFDMTPVDGETSSLVLLDKSDQSAMEDLMVQCGAGDNESDQETFVSRYSARELPSEELIECSHDVSLELPELPDPIEVFRADSEQCKRSSKSGRASAHGVKSKIPECDDVEISRMSRIRPLGPSNEANKPIVKGKKQEVKAQASGPPVKTGICTGGVSLQSMSSAGALTQIQRVFQTIRHNPPSVLYRRVCHSIGLALLRSGAPVWETVFYLTEAQAITFRHKALLTWRTRLRKLEKDEGGHLPASDTSDILVQRKHLTNMRAQLAFNKTPTNVQAAVETLPHTWTVCQVSVVSNPGAQHSHLVISRFTPQGEPLVMRMPGYSDSTLVAKLLEDYSSIFRRSTEVITVTDRSQWWKDRYSLDEDIKSILGKFEHHWLGSWKGILHGMLVNPDDQQRMTDTVNRLVNKWNKSSLVADADVKIQLLLVAESHLSEHELLQGIVDICSEPRPSAVDMCERVKLFKREAKSLNTDTFSRGPVILVLDKDLQELPWENFPCLQTQQMTRMPSVYFIAAHYRSLSTNDNSVWNQGVETNKAFYIVDPDSNLPATQETFRTWFEKMEGWQGMMQRKPTSKEFKEGISANDLFIYCGHGSGAKYLSQDSLEMSECHAASILMGCCSGKLTAAGQLEASGTMLHYFIAGGPCMMGCLWDITDRDIDRYTEHLLKALLASSGDGILDAVDTGRSACKLRYLTGAAPVIYGLPVKMATKDT